MRPAILGTFDVANYGDVLFPLVAARRLGVDPLVISPAGGRPYADALLSVPPDDASVLEADLDLVLLGGGNIIHAGAVGRVYGELDPPLPAAYPMLWLGATALARGRDIPLVWNVPGVPRPFEPRAAEALVAAVAAAALVGVRDAASKGVLEQAGVTAVVEVLPDTAWDVGSLWKPEELDEAWAGLWAAAGRDVAERALVAHVKTNKAHEAPAEIAAVLERTARGLAAEVVLLSIGPCHGEAPFLRAIAGKMASPPLVVDNPARLVDVAAALARSVGYVGASMHGAITAMAHGRPVLLVVPEADHKLPEVLASVGASERLLSRWDQVHARRSLLAPEDGVALGEAAARQCEALDGWWQRVEACRHKPSESAHCDASVSLPPALLEEMLVTSVQHVLAHSTARAKERAVLRELKQRLTVQFEALKRETRISRRQARRDANSVFRLRSRITRLEHQARARNATSE